MKELLKTLGLTCINDYKYIKQIWGGKASTSLLYKNVVNHEEVLVKMLIVPRNDEELKSFKQEALMLERLDSDISNTPKLVSTFQRHKTYPIYYYIMEYLKGISLNEFIEQKNLLPWHWEKALKFLLNLSLSLNYPSVLCVHRDLHTGNIFILNPDDFFKKDYSNIDKTQIRILDFGCSKDRIQEIIGLWEENEFRHIGAISTWSPESLLYPASVTEKHDIWAIGILFYRILTNKHPFESKNFGELLNKYQNKRIDWQYIEKKCLPEAVRILLKRMLDFDQNERFGTKEIYNMCYDILYGKLLNQNDAFLRKYVDCRTLVDYCARCHGEICGPNSKCPKCGLCVNDDNCYPAY